LTQTRKHRASARGQDKRLFYYRSRKHGSNGRVHADKTSASSTTAHANTEASGECTRARQAPLLLPLTQTRKLRSSARGQDKRLFYYRSRKHGSIGRVHAGKTSASSTTAHANTEATVE